VAICKETYSSKLVLKDVVSGLQAVGESLPTGRQARWPSNPSSPSWDFLYGRVSKLNILSKAVGLQYCLSMTYDSYDKVEPRVHAPHMWILKPGTNPYPNRTANEDWEYVARTGGQHVHYEDLTLHIGAGADGQLVCDSRLLEYRFKGLHMDLGNFPVEDLPESVVREALRMSLDNINIIYTPRQNLIRGLAARIPEYCDLPLDFPLVLFPTNRSENVVSDSFIVEQRELALGSLLVLRDQLGYTPTEQYPVRQAS
jgi:hypothetical protein